jgi:hypothetical protein
MFDGNKIKAEEALRVTLGSFQKPDSDAPTLRRFPLKCLETASLASWQRIATESTEFPSR